MDDNFPVKYEQPAFARSKSKSEIWVMILEKAWAKLFGSYARTEAG